MAVQHKAKGENWDGRLHRQNHTIALVVDAFCVSLIVDVIFLLIIFSSKRSMDKNYVVFMRLPVVREKPRKLTNRRFFLDSNDQSGIHCSYVSFSIKSHSGCYPKYRGGNILKAYGWIDHRDDLVKYISLLNNFSLLYPVVLRFLSDLNAVRFSSNRLILVENRH